MVILPAIDLKGGVCVRLRQGRADDVIHGVLLLRSHGFDNVLYAHIGRHFVILTFIIVVGVFVIVEVVGVVKLKIRV